MKKLLIVGAGSGMAVPRIPIEPSRCRVVKARWAKRKVASAWTGLRTPLVAIESAEIDTE